MKREEEARKAAVEKRKAEEAAKEAAKEAKKAERKAAKEAARQSSASGGGGGDFLARTAELQAWEAHTAPNGREYYHNNVTGVTQWKKPPGWGSQPLWQQHCQHQPSALHQWPAKRVP